MSINCTSIQCPECGFIAHLETIEYFGRTTHSSGKELRLRVVCENGHPFALEITDDSGCMTLSTHSSEDDTELSTYSYRPDE